MNTPIEGKAFNRRAVGLLALVLVFILSGIPHTLLAARLSGHVTLVSASVAAWVLLGVVAAACVALTQTVFGDVIYTAEDDALVERRWRHERRVAWSAIRALSLHTSKHGHDLATLDVDGGPSIEWRHDLTHRGALMNAVAERVTGVPFRADAPRWERRERWPHTVWYPKRDSLGLAVFCPALMLANAMMAGRWVASFPRSLVPLVLLSVGWAIVVALAILIFTTRVSLDAWRRRRERVTVDAAGLCFTDGAREVSIAWSDLREIRPARGLSPRSFVVSPATSSFSYALGAARGAEVFDALLRHYAPAACAARDDRVDAERDLSDDAPTDARSVHHFHTRPVRVGVFLLGAFSLVPAVQVWDTPSPALQHLAFAACFTVAVVAALRSVRVTLDDRGITRQRLGFTTAFAWSEITCVRRDAHESLIVDAGHVQITVDPLLSRFSLLRRTILRRAPKDVLA